MSCTAKTEYLKFETHINGLSPNFHIYMSVSELYIPMIGLPILLQENMRKLGLRLRSFLFWEYINGIFVAVWYCYLLFR
jgi:hypothetical protein